MEVKQYLPEKLMDDVSWFPNCNFIWMSHSLSIQEMKNVVGMNSETMEYYTFNFFSFTWRKQFAFWQEVGVGVRVKPRHLVASDDQV